MVKVALLIGISEYESRLSSLPTVNQDLTALQQLLCASDKGGFDEVKILTDPDSQTMREEIEMLYTERDREDLVLLYIASHALRDERNRLFFTACNTNPRRMNSTTVSADFIAHLMRTCRTDRLVVILDCCFSHVVESTLRMGEPVAIDLEHQLFTEGCVIVSSNSSTNCSYDSPETIVSPYGQALVEGLETGAADLNCDGDISILELHEYASQKAREINSYITPRIIANGDRGLELVIAQTVITTSEAADQDEATPDWGNFALGLGSADVNPLNSALTVYQSFITDLVTRLDGEAWMSHLAHSRSPNRAELENYLLNLIRQASRSDFVCVLQESEPDRWLVRSRSDLSEAVTPEDCIAVLQSAVLPRITYETIFNSDYHGIYLVQADAQNRSKAFVIVAIESRPNAQFMIIGGIPQEFSLLGDPLGQILCTFYTSNRSLFLQPALAEAVILDDLKRAYGFVPLSLYERRFQLFCERLQQMIVHFEPILHFDESIVDLNPEEVFEIIGWEALARDPNQIRDTTKSLAAPFDLFQAAELWGVRFIVELDQHFLITATRQYREALKKSGIRFYRDLKPLSVNVYPESLMNTAYFRTVQQIRLEEKLLPPDSLILEISEKTELPRYQDGVLLANPLSAFRKRLQDYVRRLRIRFAIDDFGVGYASVSRLAGLKPSHVKIDREILHHELSDVIIRFVLELARSNTLNPSNVIIEGLDETSPTSLHHLKEMGVNYIQGHIFAKASPEIYRSLSREKAESLKRLLFGQG